ncbi:MAG: mercury transporter MerT [Acidobacteria bacterium]|nr:mercuric transporter MerT family protein [Edaphobacter flagellatus]MBS1815474.1 mercury transporter MerT [Acidobacteriota bacterium]
MQSSSNANTRLALAGGLLAGIGASACCVGPLLLLSLGIGGAWIGHLTALEPYRPIFIALTVLFLGLAFRKLYLVPQACAAEGDCLADRTRRAQRILFWIFVPLSLASVASPWILPLFYR